MSGSRWFVSKSKESRRERARTSHNHGDERRDDYVSSHHRRGSERASERSRASHHGAAASSPDRKDNPRPSAAKNSEGGGGHGQLVFRRQDRVKVKQRTPDGSPRRDEHKPPSSAPSSKSRGRGDSKKPSGDWLAYVGPAFAKSQEAVVVKLLFPLFIEPPRDVFVAAGYFCGLAPLRCRRDIGKARTSVAHHVRVSLPECSDVCRRSPGRRGPKSDAATVSLASLSRHDVLRFAL